VLQPCVVDSQGWRRWVCRGKKPESTEVVPSYLRTFVQRDGAVEVDPVGLGAWALTESPGNGLHSAVLKFRVRV
jgi:hypothetical protein